MSNLVEVKVKRESIVSCMNCPLCNNLFKDATTISECLHTFCRKCIYKKLSDEEMECCPVCNTDLGCSPLEKLRPDHNLQDVRAKIFPYKRRKVNALEILPSIALPARRKERSLSSLVVSTPRVSSLGGGLTGRRSKSARKAQRTSTFSIEKPLKKENDYPESSSSPETLNKFTQSIRKNSNIGEPSNQSNNEKSGGQNGNSSWNGKSDLWKPLTCLVEVANRSKSSKFTSTESGKAEALHASESDKNVRKSKLKENGLKSKAQDGRVSPLESDKPKKMRKVRQKKETGLIDFNISPQAVLDAVSAKSEIRANAIWFSLVASKDQEGDPPLPQISASYLRIKDGNIPVSFIQKYLMRKLDLRTEDEVEIRCMGRSIVPTWQLNHLVDLWLQSKASDKVSTAIGSQAKDFVMVLAYARKVPDS